MNNLVRKGSTFLAPGPLSSGDPVKVGSLVGVAAVDIASGDTGVVERSGVFNLSVSPTTANLAAGGTIYINAGGTLDDVVAGGIVFGYSDAGNTTIADEGTATIAVVLRD